MISTIVSVMLGLYLLMYIAVSIPQVISQLMIKPNRNRKDAPEEDPSNYEISYTGIFTDLQPGRVKIKVTWYGTFVTCLMNWQGKHFVGERSDNDFSPDHQQYWEVADSGTYPDSHPLPFPMPKMRWRNTGNILLWLSYSPLSVAFWLWKRYAYKVSGAVWVGIPGFRTIRIYKLDRLVKTTNPDGSTAFKHLIDYSDHYRVGDFQAGVLVPHADTKDLVQLSVQLNMICRVINPYLVAFNTDNDWMSRLLGAATAGLNVFTRPRSYKDVIAAKDSAETALAATTITDHVRAALKAIGIWVDETQYIDATPSDPAIAGKLAAPAVAEAEAQGIERLAKANAAPIREMAEAMKQHPDEGMAALHVEGRIRMAKEAGDRAIINMDGPRSLETASFREIREMNQNLKGDTT